MTSPSGPAIACNLEALTPEERSRRALLARKVQSLATGVRELEDGYALRLAAETEIARDALEWLLLESRCCPFLRVALFLEPEHGPLWIRFSGAAGVKEFLASAGLGGAAPVESCGC